MTSLPQVVVSAVAPLWRDSAAPDRIGEPGRDYSDYLKWIDRLLATNAPLHGALDTVALCGEPVHVLDDAGPLLRVELPAQPNGAGGYVGFMNARHVGADAGRAVTQVVGPSGQAVRSSAPADPLAIARAFVGAPYVWGGLEGAGIDCSGLVHIAARIVGRVVPRDAHHQWAALKVEIGWPELRPGDLLFFGDHAGLDGIDHVGFYAGDEQLLHAPETGRAVVLEPISVRGRDRVVAFGRI